MRLGRMVKNTLQMKLMAILIMFSFLSALIVGGVIAYLSVQSTQQKIIESNSVTALQISSQISLFMDYAKGLTETLAVSPAASAMDAGKVRELILGAQQKNPQFELIVVMDVSGTQIARTSGNLTNRADRNYFKGAIAGNTFLTDVYISVFTNAPTLTISAPIKDNKGEIIGVLASDISLKAVWEIAERAAIGSTGYVDVVDYKGTLIAHPDKQRILQKENVGKNSYVQTVLQGLAGHVNAPSTTGADSLITFAPIKAYQWGVLTYLPSKEMNDSFYHILLMMSFFNR